jgi:hypothetical protein
VAEAVASGAATMSSWQAATTPSSSSQRADMGHTTPTCGRYRWFVKVASMRAHARSACSLS